MNEKLNKLAEQIMTLYINEGYGNTWNEYIEMMELTLSLILEAKQIHIDDNELIILRGLIKEALNLGLNEIDPKIRSPKRSKLYELTIKVKEEIEKFPDLKYQDEEVTDFNSWIKSLKIFKMGAVGLDDTIYETSYELYQGMRKIILDKKSQNYKKIYLYKIVEILDSEENQKKLPIDIELKQVDYELYQVIKLVKGNKDFNYHKLGNLALTKARNLDYLTNVNRVNMLIKR